MSTGAAGAVARGLGRLFASGGVTGLSEGQLLDRFVTRRDEAAFEALLARHGPMVLSVCRRLLNDPNDVDDAFQATFLVLVKKARSLRRRDLLGNWLFGVAYKVSARSRATAARRHGSETPTSEEVAALAVARGPSPAEAACLRELLDEVHRLPERYRAPVVLCDIEGLTHEEAAAQLGWPVGTVKGRLSRARDVLRSRLTRRGLHPAASVAAPLALGRWSPPSLPGGLTAPTVKAAALAAAGETTAVGLGLITSRAVALSEGVLHAMSLTQLKAGFATLAVAGGLLTGAGVYAYQADGGGPAKPSTAEDAARSAGPSAAQPAAKADDLQRQKDRVAWAEQMQRKGYLSEQQLAAERAALARLEAQLPVNPAAKDAGRPDPGPTPSAKGSQPPTSRLDPDVATDAIFDRMLADRKDWTPRAVDKLVQWSQAIAAAEDALEDHPGELDLGRRRHFLRMKKLHKMTQGLSGPEQPRMADIARVAAERGEALGVTPPNPVGSVPTAKTGATAGMVRMMAGASPPQTRTGPAASQPATKASQNRAAGQGVMMAGGGMGGFGGTGGVGDTMANAGLAVYIARTAPGVMSHDKSPRTKATLKALDAPVSMSFGKPTPFEDVIKYIKSATQGPNDAGIPVYIDPAGLAEAEKTMTTPVAIDLEGVPLKTTLRLLLKQLDMAYCVRDGILIISSVRGIHQELLEASAEQEEEDERQNAAGAAESRRKQ